MKTKILLSIIALFFVSVLYLLYLNFFTHNNNIEIRITSQTITPTDTKTNWKTYENKQYGFSFNYPDSLGEIFIIDSRIRVQNKASYSFEVSVHPSQNSFDKWFKDQQSLGQYLPRDWTQTVTKFQNFDAILLEPKFPQQIPGNVFLFKKDNNIFAIYYSITPPADQILSTFKLIN